VISSLDEQIDSEYFYKREFSFTLKNDVYCRYLCFKKAEDFHKALKEKVPHKIDIGAVYNMAPSKHNSADAKAFIPLEKEMVFDIDMSDYDNVRSCCTGATICKLCWKYMVVAVKIINRVLIEDFDLKTLLWVFSGRRGIHCWVSDDQARNMTNEMRSAITEYVYLNVGSDMTGRVRLSQPLHPSHKNAFEFIDKHFKQICILDQNLLQNELHRKKFLTFLPEES
jgi:DNA primase small subunit